MVYDWLGKEEVCYRMYIEEKRSLEEIMDYMKSQHNFAPRYCRLLLSLCQQRVTASPQLLLKRAFQTQFKRWEFPSKQNPAHRNGPLVERVRVLWERNVGQKDMLKVLLDEGYDIKERELMRVRAKNRWLLRVPNGMKSAIKNSAPDTTDPSLQSLEQILYPQGNQTESAEGKKEGTTNGRQLTPDLAPDIIVKRQERQAKLQQESAERWASRKRRRRTRGWAGLPADPPGPPRFPSETTIDESKAFLNLNNELYREIRDRFQTICEEGGFIKKTIAGPERWQAAKDRLIQESPHLQSVFWGNNTQLDAKALALDVVCTDVTKRMRTLERRMTIAEAKNVLGINPEQSRQVRNAFYQTLKADHFTSKLEAGDDHWKELKEQWIQESELLKQILGSDDSSPEHVEKVKAVEVLCRDVMKRLRDDQTKRDPARKKQRSSGPGPGAAPAKPAPSTAVRAPPVAQMQVDHGDLQIDPSLLLAANDPSMAMEQQQQQEPQQPPQSFTPGPFTPSTAYSAPASATTPVYFRLSPLSQINQSNKLWLATLTSISVGELRQLATSKHPDTTVVRIDGIVRDANNNEVPFAIDEDDELGAYLAHINGAKATFNVQLVPSYP
ncbi:MAG: hypothetical protein M1817_000402 [Caeruleum heppii]|nr:MAG: hypothetical protein M1817_000402 [Caeruleum heppii]